MIFLGQGKAKSYYRIFSCTAAFVMYMGFEAEVQLQLCLDHSPRMGADHSISI